MEEVRYKVIVDGAIVANGMALDIALILIGAMFEKYYNDTFSIAIVKEIVQI